jgi:short-subunit dehydrogenase
MAQEKVALVTGASSGIGQAPAALLLERGFRVFGTSRRAEETGELSGKMDMIQLDIRDGESVRTCLQTVLDRAGRIDALVNNAGYALIGSSEEASMEEAKEIFETNFFGTARMSRAALAVMRKQRSGRIANISSVVGFLPAPYMGLYAASKHALEGYSESMDHEVRQFGIRVSVIEPGFTRTSIGENGKLAGQLMAAYAHDRDRATAAITENIAKGDHPSTTAMVVVRALTSRSPRPRYPAGPGAMLLSRLRRFAPYQLVDRGLRKQFGLEIL